MNILMRKIELAFLLVAALVVSIFRDFADILQMLWNGEDEGEFLNAIRSDRADSVEILIKNGANVNAITRNGTTALMYASSFVERTNIVKILIKNGANVNAKESHGWTALMHAAARGCINVVEILIKNGANVNAKSPNGWTALMYASKNGHMRIAEMLIEKGADVEARNEDGQNASMLAKDRFVKRILQREKILADLWFRRDLAQDDWVVVWFEEDYVRKEVKCQASLNHQLLLHVLGRAGDELGGWLALDGLESNAALKNSYRQISSMLLEGVLCVREVRKFEDRVKYKEVGRGCFEISPNIEIFRESFEKIGGVEGILQKVLKILGEEEISLDDAQFALDFVNYDYFQRVKDVRDFCVKENDGEYPVFSALVKQEENEEREALTKVRLKIGEFIGK